MPIEGSPEPVGGYSRIHGWRVNFQPPQLEGSFSLAVPDLDPLNPQMLRMVGMFVFAAIAVCPATAPVTVASSAGDAPTLQQPLTKSPVDQLIPWLLDENQQLRGIPFGEVVFDTTGKHLLPVDRTSEIDQRVIKQISAILDEVMKKMNAPTSPIQNVGRINEVSSYFEDSLRELLSRTAGLSCDFPRTADGKIQRSGYPDLRVVDVASKRVFYLDPKLYAVGSRNSSFRAFYFEPKIATNKVRDDAVHLVVGFEHELRKDGRWRFTRWDVVDLSGFKVKLKAEFQGSNHDMYQPEAIVATSAAR